MFHERTVRASRVVASLAFVVSAACAPHRVQPAAPSAAPSGELILSVVGTNDLHGGILPQWDGRGGLAVFAGYLKNLRAARSRDGGDVVLIDGGDMFQGTLESNLGEGAAVVRAYNLMGYDAAAIGNHEFDFGPVGEAATPRAPGDDPRGALKARAAEATFPFLAANLIDEGTGKPVAWPNVRPSTIVKHAGVTIGIIGITTYGTLGKTMAANVVGLAMAPLADRVLAEADSLRKAGATVVLVAAHAGAICRRFDDPNDLSACTDEEIMALANALPAGTVDAIVAGHTHNGMAHIVNGIPIVEAYTKGVAFGRIDLRVDRATGRVLGANVMPPRDICEKAVAATGRCDAAAVKGKTLGPVIYEGDVVSPDPAIMATVQPDVARARQWREQKLGVWIPTPIRRAYERESALGNLFADLMLAARPGGDVAITNGGGLRADLPAGDLTFGHLYESTPFDNLFAEIKVTGAGLRSLVDANLGSRSSILSIAGFRVKAACEDGKLKVSLFRPDGKPIADNETFVLVTSDFLATGGDFLFPSAELPPSSILVDQNMLVRDGMADLLRARGGTLRESDLIDPARPRWVYPGKRPVQCPES
jgi:5'-nucleotidase